MEAEIAGAVRRFVRGVDLVDRALLISALTPGASLDPRPAASRWGAAGALLAGRDAVADLILGMFAGRVATAHTVTGARADLAGDVGRVTVPARGRYRLTAAGPGEDVRIVYRCTAGVVRDGDTWLLSHIRVDTASYSGDPLTVFCR